jgi:hypothetical protein
MRRILLVLLALLSMAAVAPVRGSVTIDSLNQPPVEGDIDFCQPGCDLQPHGNHTAFLRFEFDPVTGSGTVMFRDTGVRYDGKPFALDATLTQVESWTLEGGFYGYRMDGTYQAHGAGSIPSGQIVVWLDVGPRHAYVTVYATDYSGFTYINQGLALRADIPVPAAG